MIIMGRIKGTPVKKLGNDIISELKDKFSADFTKNKKIIREAREIKSKKTLNLVAGYVTNEVKKLAADENRSKRRIETKRREREPYGRRPSSR